MIGPVGSGTDISQSHLLASVHPARPCQVNAAAPFGFFSLLSLLQFSVQPENLDGWYNMEGINHRAQLSLMLVLTASAYKMAITGKLPDIAYLTLLDKYMLLCSLFIVLVAIQSRILNWFVEWRVDISALRLVDRVSFAFFSFLWFTLQVWYLYYMYALSSGLILRDVRAAEIFQEQNGPLALGPKASLQRPSAEPARLGSLSVSKRGSDDVRANSMSLSSIRRHKGSVVHTDKACVRLRSRRNRPGSCSTQLPTVPPPTQQIESSLRLEHSSAGFGQRV